MKLTKKVVEKISSIKGEPKWMLDFRLRSLDAFLKSNVNVAKLHDEIKLAEN